MISQLKSETARINGAKSHGPKTPEGREKSSQNALKHGGASGRGVLLACESTDEYKDLHDTYVTTYDPRSAAETALVDQMAAARWRIIRLDTIEVGLLDDEMARQDAKPAADPGALLSRAFRSLADGSHSLALASRYQSRQHRIHDRAYKTLRELQQARLSKEPEGKLEVGWITPEQRIEREKLRAENALRLAALSHDRAAADAWLATNPEFPAVNLSQDSDGMDPYTQTDAPSSIGLPNEPTATATKELSDPLSRQRIF